MGLNLPVAPLLLTHLKYLLAGKVAGHDNHRVLEIHRPALAIRQPAIVKYLQQDVKHIPMSFSISSRRITE